LKDERIRGESKTMETYEKFMTEQCKK